MLYFVVLWKNKKLSEWELSYIAKDIEYITTNFATFQCDHPDRLPYLASCTKSWVIISEEEMYKLDFKLLWTNAKITSQDKKDYGIKRFKVVDLMKTDYEVKTKGTEILHVWGLIGHVRNYQNIWLYEEIDFNKPMSSMNIGMMPSKLAHIMLNIATGLEENQTVFDPFCGLGTTLFIANALGHNTIGSDINITPCKQNVKWWGLSKFNTDNKKHLFKHDVKDKFKSPILKSVDCIVSEWFLGPIVKNYLSLKQAQFHEKEIQPVYIEWIRNLLELNPKNITITLPVYNMMDRKIYHFHDTIKKLREFANVILADEIYMRKDQKIGRMIIQVRGK